MMNPEAMKRMEDMAEMILRVPAYRRDKAYQLLKEEAGWSDEDLQHFCEFVFYYHLFTDTRFYKAVEKAVGERLYEDFHH